MGFRKQVTEAKEGSLELRREGGKGNIPAGKKEPGRERQGCASQRMCLILGNHTI